MRASPPPPPSAAVTGFRCHTADTISCPGVAASASAGSVTASRPGTGSDTADAASAWLFHVTR
ncbi:MAG: hypothetical protein LBK99_21395 [Opitutaceae bacterium]|nr:hypothetical protein [Opitutaceae bacterium]